MALVLPKQGSGVKIHAARKHEVLDDSLGLKNHLCLTGGYLGGGGSAEEVSHLCLGDCNTVRSVPVPTAGRIQPHDFQGSNLHQGTFWSCAFRSTVGDVSGIPLWGSLVLEECLLKCFTDWVLLSLSRRAPVPPPWHQRRHHETSYSAHVVPHLLQRDCGPNTRQIHQSCSWA